MHLEDISKFDDKYCQEQIMLAKSKRMNYINEEKDRNIWNDGLSNEVSQSYSS